MSIWNVIRKHCQRDRKGVREEDREGETRETETVTVDGRRKNALYIFAHLPSPHIAIFDLRHTHIHIDWLSAMRLYHFHSWRRASFAQLPMNKQQSFIKFIHWNGCFLCIHAASLLFVGWRLRNNDTTGTWHCRHSIIAETTTATITEIRTQTFAFVIRNVRTNTKEI